MKLHCICSHQHRFIYLVTPKVACSSIKWALLPLLQQGDLTPEDHAAQANYPDIHRFLRSRRLSFARTRLKNGLRKGEFADYTRFSFVRNPWDRIVSCYESKVGPSRVKPVTLKLNGEPGHFWKGMPFADFVRCVCAAPDARSNVHFVSQARILSAADFPDGPLLVDHVGQFERLEQDFADIMARIVPGGVPPLRRHNPSPRRDLDYRRYFDDALAELVAQRYAADIHRFGYAF